MSVPLLPQTRLGKASGFLLVAFVLLIALNAGLDASQNGPDPDWMRIPSLASAAVALAMGIVAILAIVRAHDRSVTVFLAFALVLLILAFELVEGFVAG